jgi:hypothetical protein
MDGKAMEGWSFFMDVAIKIGALFISFIIEF